MDNQSSEKNTQKPQKKAYLTLTPVLLKNSRGEPITIDKDTMIRLDPTKAEKLVAQGKITASWVQWLSLKEREKLPQKTEMIMKSEKLPREESEAKAVRLIIEDRIIPGKCDACEKKDWCLLTKHQRALCEIVKKP